jgi:hypothetical protein
MSERGPTSRPSTPFERQDIMAKGQEKPGKNNKPKLSVKEKKAKKKAPK